MIYAAWPQGGGEDSPELINTDAEVSSLIDAEAQGKFIYNSLLPGRPAQRSLPSGVRGRAECCSIVPASAHPPGSSLSPLLGQCLPLLHPPLPSLAAFPFF